VYIEDQTTLITTKNYKIRVVINIKYLLMYLTVLTHFSIKQVNTLGDICNENILLMNKMNVGTKTVLIVIQNF
jgi:hypothetical protein